MQYLIGIDIGTSGTKAVLFDLAGNTVADELIEYPLYQPKNGWAEQDPEDWWKATVDAIRSIVAKAGAKKDEVLGIGLSGQMHGLVMLDEADRVIRRSIIWCDQRTAAEAADITDLVGADKLIEITANPALTGFTAAKIMWVKKNEPENFARCKKIMLPKDYIRYRLTGEFATEVSDASGMQLLDVPGRKWSPYVCDKLGIDISLLGRVYESAEVTGKLTPAVAEMTGLSTSVVVVGGAGDQAASAVGNGIVREGIVSATIGTSGVVFAHTDTPQIDPRGRVHTLCHAVPGAWHIMGVTQGAGLSFKWLRDNFFTDVQNTAALLSKNANKLLDEICADVPAGANSLIYLPYLMGERTPHLDSDARGVFFGLSAMHGRADMLRAVMEGVTFSLLDCMNIIRELGTSPDFVFASGGGGNSKLWRQMMADAFGVRVAQNSSREGGALGVAILAGVGAGVYESVAGAAESLIHETTSISPIPENNEKYSRVYALYDKLYGDLKDSFKTLAQL
ncbi:MAG: xylulokinase [Clostridia bacterium]|nr:xylulokinase [Clostridia bacterium]